MVVARLKRNAVATSPNNCSKTSSLASSSVVTLP